MSHETEDEEGKEDEDLKIIREGTSGTDISGNRFAEEYLVKLQQTDGPFIWDEMRRSDDQVAMLLRVVKNPLMSARWFIEPVDDSEEEIKLAEFVTHVLIDNMGTEDHPKSFEKFKREALTSVEFGYSLFEITNKIVFDDEFFGTYIGLKGLDWRSPKTIEEWFLTQGGELEGVRQEDNSDRVSNICLPGKFLLHIAAEMEGDNYEGISMLRPIYGNWLRKNIMRKIQMIGIERAATGVPIGVIPQGQLGTASQTALENSLSRFVSHQRGYMTIPEGYDVKEFKITHDAEKVQSAIDSENVGMAKSFLANFMELGLNGSSGSFALGTDLSDIFLSGIAVYGDAIVSPVNMKVIPSIIKWNFGERRKYPKLKIEGINDKAGKEFAEVMDILTKGGLVQITDKLRTVIHKKYNLPDFDKDAEEDITDTSGVPTSAGSGQPQQSELSGIRYNFAEKTVSGQIKNSGQDLTQVMSIGMRGRGVSLVNNMMDIWRNTQKSKRMSEVNKLNVPGKNEYKKVISEILAETYVQATEGVKQELAGDNLKLADQSEIRDLPAESKATGASQSDLLVETQDADLRKNLFFSFTSKLDKLPTEEQMNANLLDVVDQYVTGPSIRTGGPNAIANAVNLARNAVFQQKSTLDRIESFIFINPSPEAAICVQLKNRVFTKEEYVVSDKLPPLHHNCNSIIKAQVAGRKGNKAISPAGLSIQGTDKQIEQIQKSITL